MLFRVLLLGFLVWVALRWLRGWRVEISRREPPAPMAGGHADPRFEPMARCAACQVHLPRNALSPAGRCGACERNARA